MCIAWQNDISHTEVMWYWFYWINSHYL